MYVRWETSGKDDLVCYVRWEKSTGGCTIIDQSYMYAFNGLKEGADEEGQSGQQTAQETFVQKKVSKPDVAEKAKVQQVRKRLPQAPP
jgi:hypothetical protein